MKNKLIFNLYYFQSSVKLGKNGTNNSTNKFIKKIKLNKKISVNLNGDKIYKIKIK